MVLQPYLDLTKGFLHPCGTAGFAATETAGAGAAPARGERDSGQFAGPESDLEIRKRRREGPADAGLHPDAAGAKADQAGAAIEISLPVHQLPRPGAGAVPVLPHFRDQNSAERPGIFEEDPAGKGGDSERDFVSESKEVIEGIEARQRERKEKKSDDEPERDVQGFALPEASNRREEKPGGTDTPAKLETIQSSPSCPGVARSSAGQSDRGRPGVLQNAVLPHVVDAVQGVACVRFRGKVLTADKVHEQEDGLHEQKLPDLRDAARPRKVPTEVETALGKLLPEGFWRDCVVEAGPA